MVYQHSMPIPADQTSYDRYAGARSDETDELIDRMALDLKSTSDRDLPHCYFVEQARLRLAGIKTRDRAVKETRSMISTTTVHCAGSVFYAWAMPD